MRYVRFASIASASMRYPAAGQAGIPFLLPGIDLHHVAHLFASVLGYGYPLRLPIGAGISRE